MPKLVTTSTPTGWDKNADSINYGSTGLVGHWWKELYLEFEFEENVSICGTTTDYNNHPYTIKVDDQEITSATGSHVFGRNIETKKMKVEWEKTDGTNGIHFQFKGFVSSNTGNTSNWHLLNTNPVYY